MTKLLMSRAAILAALFTMLFTFMMHAPCRNSSYTDAQFTSFCYSDIPVQFADKTLPTDIAPIPYFLMWLTKQVPGDFLLHTVVFQLMISAAFVASTLMVGKFPVQKPNVSLIFALMPLWVFTAFISSDLIAIVFSIASILFFYKRKLEWSAVFAGFAIASGSWTWIVPLSILIQIYKYATSKHLAKYAAITFGTTLFLNIPRIVQHQPLLTFSNEYGDGTPLYLWSLLSGNGSPQGLISIWLGLALTVFVIRWSVLSVFDFRVELLVLIFACIGVLTDTSISPQSLTHILFLMVIAFPNKSYLLRITVPMIIYVISVWMNYENEVGTRGINPINYAIFAVVLWVVIISVGFKAADYASVPGDDEVLAARNFEVIK